MSVLFICDDDKFVLKMCIKLKLYNIYMYVMLKFEKIKDIIYFEGLEDGFFFLFVCVLVNFC